MNNEENASSAAIETERPRSFSSRNLNIEDIDTESNPQLVAVYVKDIYRYLHELEVFSGLLVSFFKLKQQLMFRRRLSLGRITWKGIRFVQV